MNVEYLTYKKKQYPVRLSYRVFKGMKSELAGKVVDFENLNPELLEAMLWYGLVSGHQAEEKKMDLTKEVMEDVLDECFREFMEMIPRFFPNAKMGNVVPNLENQKVKEEKVKEGD